MVAHKETLISYTEKHLVLDASSLAASGDPLPQLVQVFEKAGEERGFEAESLATRGWNTQPQAQSSLLVNFSHVLKQESEPV